MDAVFLHTVFCEACALVTLTVEQLNVSLFPWCLLPRVPFLLSFLCIHRFSWRIFVRIVGSRLLSVLVATNSVVLLSVLVKCRAPCCHTVIDTNNHIWSTRLQQQYQQLSCGVKFRTLNQNASRKSVLLAVWLISMSSPLCTVKVIPN